MYSVLKLFPLIPNKVLFLSRQSNELSLDFQKLKDELLLEKPELQIVEICNRLDDKKEGVLGFAVDTLRSMYHLATSEVCVLDAYWPAVSVLKHKEQLTVIQMWHALGKIKQSGYQTIGKESGRNREISEIMRMHKNYDYIIAGGKAWNPYYVASFGANEESIVNIGLPRIDYLLETAEENKKKVWETYPEFKEKKVVLYAPTFRRGMESKWESLMEHFCFEDSILIVKGHPNQTLDSLRKEVYCCPEFSAVELLAACDYLITDYSAIAIEAAILNKKTLYYLYDYEEYAQKNGINVNPFESMPGCAFKEAEELIAYLEMGKYDQKVLQDYREKYLPEELGTSTRKLAELVIKNL